MLKSKLKRNHFCVINIYSPNNHINQENFVQTLSEHIILKRDTSRVDIAGDWNLTLNRIDKQGELAWKPTASRNAVADLMDELNLIVSTGNSILAPNRSPMSPNR